MEITATIDGKVKVVSEASIRRHLKLEDSDGISDLPTTETFKQLALVGYVSNSDKFNFSKGTLFPLVEIFDPYHSSLSDEAASTGVDVRHGGAATTVFSDEGRIQHNELMDLVTKLSDKVVYLETDLQQTKKVYGAAYTKLIKKVKRLEDKLNKLRRKRRLGRHDHEMEADFEFTTTKDVSTSNVPVNTAGAKISTASPKVKTTGVSVDDVAAKSLVPKLHQEKERLRFEEAQRLQEQFDEEKRQRITSIHEEASTFKPNEELAHMLQAQERERYSEADKEKLLVKLINERKRQFAQQRDQQRRNTPLTQAQQRSYICNYIKHMGSHTLQQLRGYSFDEIKVLFEATMKMVNTFTPMKNDDTVPKVVTGSSKRSAEEELGDES
ncbi:hypothetical protein Tco_1149409 [Tanacetum coccineum]